MSYVLDITAMSSFFDPIAAGSGCALGLDSEVLHMLKRYTILEFGGSC